MKYSLTLAIRIKVLAELFHTTKKIKVANSFTGTVIRARALSPCPPFSLGAVLRLRKALFCPLPPNTLPQVHKLSAD